MTKGRTIELAEYLENRIGDRLRSVIHYDEGDYSIVLARDDVAERYSVEGIESVVSELLFENFETAHQEGLYVHGDLNCSIRCFERGVEMHFPHSENAGSAVALDPQVTEDLYSFVGDCLTVIGSS